MSFLRTRRERYTKALRRKLSAVSRLAVSFQHSAFSFWVIAVCMRLTSEELAEFEETACLRAQLGNVTLNGKHLPS
jgi:hypothetical protein